jgi:hypothetical protein
MSVIPQLRALLRYLDTYFWYCDFNLYFVLYKQRNHSYWVILNTVSDYIFPSHLFIYLRLKLCTNDSPVHMQICYIVEHILNVSSWYYCFSSVTSHNVQHTHTHARAHTPHMHTAHPSCAHSHTQWHAIIFYCRYIFSWYRSWQNLIS